MIVLHKPKVIFLKAQKVGGTSFEIALSKYADSGDIITPITAKDELIREQLGFQGACNYGYSAAEVFSDRGRLLSLLKGRWPKKFYNHMSAKAVKELLDGNQWHDYLKLSIVRNPFDCAVSRYYHRNKGGNLPPFEDWCLAHGDTLNVNNQQYLIDGQSVVDYFIRYEALEEDIRALEVRCPQLEGLYDTFKAINAKGSYRPKAGTSVAEMFADAAEAKALVERLSAFEIREFGYSAG